MNKDVAILIEKYIDLSELLKDDNILKYNKIVADLFISNKCNLSCKHCYFGDTKNIKPSLIFEEWLYTINSLYDNGIRHFHISGKECSLEPQSINIINHIKSKKDTYCGVVTNGTGNSSYYEKLIKENIDYIEFSIDGFEYQHNYIRNNNTFQTTLESIKNIVKKSPPETINIATTLNNNNWREYIDLISYFHKIGVTRFFATPFLEKGEGIKINNLLLSSYHFAQLIMDTFSFMERCVEKGIIIKYCVPHHLIMTLLNENQYISNITHKYFKGENDLVFRIKDNIFQLSFPFIELDYLNMLIITNDGYIIPCADDICYPNYSEFALGNIRENTIKEILEKRICAIKQEINNLLN